MCIRNVTVVSGRVPSSSGHMSVYRMYTGRIKGYTECGVKGMCPDFVFLVNNDLWILAGMKFVEGLLVAVLLDMQISDLKTLNNQTPFLS